MKRYTAEELAEILSLHKEWLNGRAGIRANLQKVDLRGHDLRNAILQGVVLRGADLSHVDLYDADLSTVDLSYANLCRANLCRAKLCGASLYNVNLQNANLQNANLLRASLFNSNLLSANLRDTNLSFANLSNTNLCGAALHGANLTKASLWDVIGDKIYIKTLALEKYTVAYTAVDLQIGCQQSTFEEWASFSDETISDMEKDALAWWKKWKETIFKLIEMSPAEPTGYVEKQDEHEKIHN